MKSIKEIQKIASETLPYVQEKVYALTNEVCAEVTYLLRQESDNIRIQMISDFLKKNEPEIRSLLKKDSTFVLPYIRKIIQFEEEGNHQEAYSHFINVKKPIAEVVKLQNEIMNELILLKQKTQNFNLFFVQNQDLRKLITHLFDLYQTFEKYLFIEENLLITSLVNLIEFNRNVENSEENKNQEWKSIDII